MMSLITKAIDLIPPVIVRWALVLAILANVLSFWKGMEYQKSLQDVATIELIERQDKVVTELKRRLQEQRVENEKLANKVAEGLLEAAKDPDANRPALSRNSVRRLNTITSP